jgi:AraC-like DNA-binding protein
MRPWRVPFQRTKYGREMLVDAAYLSDLGAFEPTPRPHALTFYDILLVTRGRGAYHLDDRAHTVAPGVVLFTRPGQIRRWAVSNLDGACVFFTGDFVSETFRDARFLEQFRYFAPDATEAAMRLARDEREAFLRAFGAIASEIRALRSDAPDLIRARLYELLVLLNRWYSARYPDPVARDVHPALGRFRTLVERHFASRHRVSEYADEVGVTPGHLNALCRWHLGQSAGSLIRQRLALEAKRMLIHGDAPAFAVARELGFRDPAYFARFFRREVGTAPRRFRLDRRHPGASSSA